MDLLENDVSIESSGLNFSYTGNELNYTLTDLSSKFVNISEINITGNETQSKETLFQVPPVAVVVLSLFYGAICIVAILGNLLVIGLIVASKHMRTVTNIFIANLALADIIIAVFTIPFQFRAALLQRWDLPKFLCAVCPFVQVLTVTVSILTLVVIALDRYRAVIHPFKAKSSKKTAFGAILAIWVLSVFLALPTQMDYSVIKVTKNGRTKDFCANVNLPDKFRVYYNQGIVIIQYFFPLIIISRAYLCISRTLWSSNTPGNQEEARDALVLRKKEKAIKMLFTVVAMFALCWFPLQTYNFLQVIFPAINSFPYINVLWFCFHWLAMSNSCCNPFIYAFFNSKFKTELLKRIPCLAKVLPVYFSRNGGNNVQMNNRTSVCYRREQSRSCTIRVIYNPIELSVQNKANTTNSNM